MSLYRSTIPTTLGLLLALGIPAVLDVIRNGVDGTAMAAYPAGISDEMAVQFATYVWAVSRGRVEP